MNVDPAVLAALIAVAGGAAVGGIGWLIRRRVTKKDLGDQEKRQKLNERQQAFDSLTSAGRRLLAALDDLGDMGSAEVLAREELSEARDKADQLGDAEVSELGSRLANAASTGGRESLQTALADIEDARRRSS